MMRNKSIQTFFSEHAPPQFSAILVKRTAKQLCRDGIETMDALIVLPIEKLKNIRNIGKKSLEIAICMREKYSAQNIAGS